MTTVEINLHTNRQFPQTASSLYLGQHKKDTASDVAFLPETESPKIKQTISSTGRLVLKRANLLNFTRHRVKKKKTRKSQTERNINHSRASNGAHINPQKKSRNPSIPPSAVRSLLSPCISSGCHSRHSALHKTHQTHQAQTREEKPRNHHHLTHFLLEFQLD